MALEELFSTMETKDTFTICIAVYAAIVSTIVLIWDIIKWKRTGVKINLSYSLNMRYSDSRKDDPTRYIALKAFNNGGKPTTITNLAALSYASWFSAYFRKNMATDKYIITEPSIAQRIPYKFEVGDQWIGMVIQNEGILDSTKGKYLFLVLFTSDNLDGYRIRIKNN